MIEASRPSKKSREQYLLSFIFFFTAVYLFSQKEYWLGLFSVVLIILVFKIDSLKSFSIKKDGLLKVEFYKERLATIMKVVPEQLERIPIDNGEVIIGIARSNMSGIIVRFLADIKRGFVVTTTIELIDEKSILYNQLFVGAGQTGIFEDTMPPKQISYPIRLRIRVLSQTGERIYGSVFIPKGI